MDWKCQHFSLLNTNHNYIICVKAISGDGAIIPPLIILNGVLYLHHQYTNITEDLLNNYLLRTLDLGYTNNMLLID